MTSDDWKTVLLALIATVGGLLNAAIGLGILYLRARLKDAAQNASEAKDAAAETKTLINGRMDELLRIASEKAYAEGRKAGLANTMQAIAESPKVSLDAQGVAAAVAAAVSKPAPPEKT